MTKRKPSRRVSPEPPPKQAPASDPARWHLLVLFLLACGVYANTLGSGFVTDDRLQVLKNPLITDFRHIPDVFARSMTGFMGATNNFYRPTHYLVYMLLYSVAGLRPFAYHLLLVLLHGLTTVLVYLLVRRIARSATAALAAAALFALHPIHTEVVNWVAAVPDALVTPVMVLGFWLFLLHDAAPRGRQIAAHCGLYLLALLTKEPGATLIFLYAGYEWICLGKGLREMRRNALLYAAMLGTLAFYLVCRFEALGSLAPAQQRFHHLTAIQFLLSVVITAAEYAWKLVFPVPLQYYYPFEAVRSVNLVFLVSLAVLVAIAILLFRWRGRKLCEPADVPEAAVVAFGIFWIAITLAPALNLTGVGRSVFGERYLYLPSVGFACAAGVAWHWWARRSRTAALTAGAVVLALFAVQVIARNRDWQDNVTLLERSIAQTPSGPELHGDLSVSYAERGDRARAIAEGRAALALDPANVTFRLNLGNILLASDPAESVRICQSLVRDQPSSADAHYCLGLAYGASGNTPQAQAELEKTVALEPAHSYAMLVLAGIYGQSGRIGEALDLCRRAAAIRPLDPEPHVKMSMLDLQSRQYPESIREAQEALRLDPEPEQAYLAHYYLGFSYRQTGSLQPALAEFASALRLKPDSPQARGAYQEALAASGAK